VSSETTAASTMRCALIHSASPALESTFAPGRSLPSTRSV
jgi:hypothetical protein